MVKPKDSTARITYSVRLNPELLKQLKHIAVDENKTVGELVEEGITVILQKRKKQTK
jgi:predicted transcriptional regulator